jgi:isochorismate synthase
MHTAFSEIVAHINKGLPFVMYRKPNAPTVKAMLQKDDELYDVQGFSIPGFVIAPFDTHAGIFMFPEDKCTVLECNLPEPPKNLNISIHKKPTTTAEHFHKTLVAKAIKAIEKGSFSKVVLSRVHELALSENPLKILPELFVKLHTLYPTAMVYCWYHPSIGYWMGATPEKLFSVEGSRINTMALAGTQKFVDGQEAVWGAKEREEQQLVTNFIANGLQPLTTQLSVGEQLTARAGHLWHLKTEISGELISTENTIQKLVTALHPTPAVCGVPRKAATAFILENENYNRALYTGFFGELQLSSTLKADFYVNLRCMQLLENTAQIYVGGGITKDSVPQLEWEETVHKAMTMQGVFGGV